jgi:hypothetical protein
LAMEVLPMEVTYQLTPQDIWAFQQFHARRKLLGRIFNGFGMVIVILVWLLTLGLQIQRLIVWQHLYSGLPNFWQVYWSFHHSSLMYFIVYTLFVFYILWGTRLIFIYQQRGVQALREQVTTRLYSDAILITAPKQNNRLNWADIREIAGNRHYLFFYTSPVTAVIVPRRMFADDGMAFEATARAFKSDPLTAQLPATGGNIWPPPPTHQNAPVAPVVEEAPDPPGTLAISYVTRKSDAWRSALHGFITRPATILKASVPLIVSALFIAFASHTGMMGYGLALLIAFAVTILLILNQVRVQFAARYPARDSTRDCVSKIRPDAFIDISPNGRTLVHWSNIGTIALVRGDVFLRRKDGIGSYFIPRSAFQSPSDAQTALDTMRRFQQQASLIG